MAKKEILVNVCQYIQMHSMWKFKTLPVLLLKCFKCSFIIYFSKKLAQNGYLEKLRVDKM